MYPVYSSTPNQACGYDSICIALCVEIHYMCKVLGLGARCVYVMPPCKLCVNYHPSSVSPVSVLNTQGLRFLSQSQLSALRGRHTPTVHSCIAPPYSDFPKPAFIWNRPASHRLHSQVDSVLCHAADYGKCQETGSAAVPDNPASSLFPVSHFSLLLLKASAHISVCTTELESRVQNSLFVHQSNG